MPVFLDSLTSSYLPRALIAAGAVSLLAACSSMTDASSRIAGVITPYQVEIVQGNFVSKEQKQVLQIGMPRNTVREILGSPLVTSAFHADRWDYVFTIRRQGTPAQQRKLSVFFKGDELVKIDSDELISEEEFVVLLVKDRKFGKAPNLELSEQELPKPAPLSADNQAGAATGSVAAGASTTPRVYPPLEPAVR